MSQTIQIEKLKVVIDGRTILDIAGWNASIKKCLVLIGPNGAGKSTWMRVVSGVQSASESSMQIRSEDSAPAELRARPSRTAIVFQKPILFRGTVADNLRLVRPRTQPKAEFDLALHEVVARLELGKLMEKRANRLSGGECQLVAIARSVLLKPDLLFLDEPTSQLDPYRTSLVETLMQSNELLPETRFIWATHNLDQAKRIATEVTIILNGKLLTPRSNREFWSATDFEDERVSRFLRGELVW